MPWRAFFPRPPPTFKLGFAKVIIPNINSQILTKAPLPFATLKIGPDVFSRAVLDTSRPWVQSYGLLPRTSYAGRGADLDGSRLAPAVEVITSH